MELYQVSKGAYQYYTQNVRGNKGLDELQVQKKLTRNVLLSRQIPTIKGRTICFYGNLRMIVKGNKIIHIMNLHHTRNWFHLDKEKYNMLNKELGIKE